MRETAIIEGIRELAARGYRSRALTKGIGDDCAVLRPPRGQDLVFTTDFVLEGRHFERGTHSAGDVGHKALARSLSDLAAMGAEPVFCLVSLAVPAELAGRWTKSFYNGLLALAEKHRIALAGGDLARFDKVLVDVMCCGKVPKGNAILRSGARPGDAIYVTGELGESARGFETQRGAAWRRHKRPEPRVAAGMALRRLGVSAAIDLSDGLSLDLERLCRESKVSADLNGDVPVMRGASLEEALHGGEDYELLFTAPAKTRVPDRIEDVAVRRIGTIVRGKAGVVRWKGRAMSAKGFDHFA